jgi:putative hemolysin
LRALAAISRPLVWLLGRATDLAVRLAGSDPRRHHEDITPAEIRDLVITHRGFTPEQRMIITGAVEITERILREILVPRRTVFTLEVDTPVGEARELLAASGHSRAPVVRYGNLDEPLGVVALRDLARDGPADLMSAARPPYLLPDTLRVADALRQFKTDREQFALVVDEHGAVDGIVTLEDLLEELVGEIYDDYDRDIAGVQRGPDGSFLLPGTFPIHDLPDLGLDLAALRDGMYGDGLPGRTAQQPTTVAGLVIAHLGHLPTKPGETITIDGWTAQVTGVERRTVTGVRLIPRHAPPPDAADR